MAAGWGQSYPRTAATHPYPAALLDVGEKPSDTSVAGGEELSMEWLGVNGCWLGVNGCWMGSVIPRTAAICPQQAALLDKGEWLLDGVSNTPVQQPFVLSKQHCWIRVNGCWMEVKSHQTLQWLDRGEELSMEWLEMKICQLE